MCAEGDVYDGYELFCGGLGWPCSELTRSWCAGADGVT